MAMCGKLLIGSYPISGSAYAGSSMFKKLTKVYNKKNL